jgi:hypothetical protein
VLPPSEELIDAAATGVVEDDGEVVGVELATVTRSGAHDCSIAASVLGPTVPQPVVAGVPDETMP